jgi:hypothetical protein
MGALTLLDLEVRIRSEILARPLDPTIEYRRTYSAQHRLLRMIRNPPNIRTENHQQNNISDFWVSDDFLRVALQDLGLAFQCL